MKAVCFSDNVILKISKNIQGAAEPAAPLFIPEGKKA